MGAVSAPDQGKFEGQKEELGKAQRMGSVDWAPDAA